MRIFSYRNKRLLKRTLLIALAVLLGILALIVCRFIYLGRFVTYDNAGAHLDYEQHLTATRAPEPAVSDEDFSFDTVLDAASEEHRADGKAHRLLYHNHNARLRRRSGARGALAGGRL